MPDPKSYAYYCIEAEQTFNYMVYAPDSRNDNSSKPLIILLHARGHNPSDILAYKGMTNSEYLQDAIIACPQGCNTRGWYGSRGDDFNDEETGGHHHGDKESAKRIGYYSEADVINVLGHVRKLHNIDAKKIYVMGHGMGGSGAIHLASKYPHLWAGVSVAAPDLKAIMQLQLPDAVLRPMKDIPIKVYHGANDKTIPVSFTRDWVRVMKQLDMTFQYLELDKIGYDFSVIDKWPKESFEFFRIHSRTRPAPPVLRPSMFFDPPKPTTLFMDPYSRAKSKIWRSSMLNGGASVKVKFENATDRFAQSMDDQRSDPDKGHLWV